MRLNEMAVLLAEEHSEDPEIAYEAFENYLVQAEELLLDLASIEDAQIQHLIALLGILLESIIRFCLPYFSLHLKRSWRDFCQQS